jgi:DNA-3-methyladenine glycosylase I
MIGAKGGVMFEKQAWMQRAGEYPRSDQEYFGLLARAVFSAGLGPKVVESRWKDMGVAFHGFDPAKVEQMGEDDVGRLLGDPAVIRNRRKIEAVIRNARTFRERTKEHKNFHAYLGELGAGSDVESAAEGLAQTFTHLGRTSALFFLFSAGWRPSELADS